MFVLDRFAGECSYCYTKAQEDRMTVCECGTEMCSVHTNRHIAEEHKRIGIVVYGTVPQLEIEVDSNGIEVDTEHISSVVRNTLLYPNIAREKTSMKKCTHMVQ